MTAIRRLLPRGRYGSVKHVLDNAIRRRPITRAARKWFIAEGLEARRLLSTVTWTNGHANGLWTDPLNWTGGTGVPTAADNAVIPSGFTTVTLNSGTQSVNSLTCASPLTISAGTLNLATTSTDSSTLTLSGGTLGGAGDLTASGTFNWTAGTMQGAGKTVIAAGATLNLSNTTVLARVLENDGTAAWTSGSLIMTSGTVNNNGTWTANSTGTLQSYGNSGINAFNNNAGASFTQAGTGLTDFFVNSTAVAFNNAATVNINQGELDFLAGGSQTGNFAGTAGATLAFGGNHTFSPASTITGNSNLRVDSGTNSYGNSISTTGSVTFHGGSFTTGGTVTAGTLSFTGGTGILNGATSAGGGTFSSGTLDGSGAVTYSGTLNWTAGTMQGAGKTVIAGGGTLTIGGTVSLDRVLENDGTATWTTGTLIMIGGTVNNNGSWTANNTNTLQSYGNGGTNAFNNHTGATFTQAGTGTTQFFVNSSAVAFNNAGTVNFNQGELQLSAGGSQTGSFAGMAGATLAFGGNHTFSGSATITGNGNLRIDSGTSTGLVTPIITTGSVTFHGGSFSTGGPVMANTLSFTGGTGVLNAASSAVGGTFAGGTLDGSGDVTYSGTLNLTSGTMQGAGKTVIAAGGSLIVGGNLALNRVLENDAGAAWTAGAILMIGGTVNNNGTWTTSSTGTLQCYGNGGTNAFNNNSGATFFQSGTGTTQFFVNSTGVAFNNAGTVNVQAGTLQLLAGGNQTGAFTVAATSTLTLNGTHTFAAGSTVTGAGTLAVTGGASTFASAQNISGTLSISGGTAVFNGNVTAGSLAMSGGTLGGAGNVTLTGTSSWSAGTMQDAGKTVIAAGATLGMTGTDILARVLENDGTVNWTSGVLLMTNGTANNNGSWTANSAGTLQSYSNVGATANAFNNNAGATFTQAGTGTTQFIVSSAGVAFNNAGTVTVQAGILQLLAGGSQTGTFTDAAGATLSLNGTHTFAAGSTVTGPGTLAIPGGVSTFASAQNISGTLSISGGTGNFNANLTAVSLAMSSGALGGGNATLTGTSSWSGGTMQDAGKTIIAAGATLNITNTVTLARVLENDGVVNWTGGAFLMTNGTVNNNATWTANSTGTLQSYSNVSATTNAFNNDAGATFTQAGAGLTQFTVNASAVAFNNFGTVNVTAGTLQLNGGGTNNTAINISGGATLNFTSAYTNAAGSTLSGAGAVIFGGTVTFAGPMTIPCVATLNPSGTLAGTGDLTFTNTLSWTGGTMAAGAKTTIAAGATLSITNSATLGRVLQNDGTANWTGGAFLMAGGTVNNNASWTANSSGTLQTYSNTVSTDAFNNNAGATFTQSGTGITQITFNASPVAFNNSGTVNVTAGELQLNGGGTNNTAMNVGGGATLNFSGNYTHAAGSTLSGAGTVDLGNTQTFAGPITIPCMVVIINTATLTGPGDITFTGPVNWTGGTMAAGARTIIAAGATLNITNTVTLSRILENDGAANWTGGTFLMAGGTVNNNASWTANSSGTLPTYSNTASINAFNNDAGATFTQAGTGLTQFTSNASAVVFNNVGTVNVTAGVLQLSTALNALNLASGTLTGGTWDVFTNSRLTLPGSITTLASNVLLDGTNSIITNTNATTNALAGLSTITNGGSLSLQHTQSLSVTPTGGTLTNHGTVSVGPGSQLSVTGALTQASDGTFVTQINGPTATSFGQIVSSGVATVGGTLQANLGNAYDPDATLTFAVVTGSSRVGTFATLSGANTPSGRQLRAHYTATSALVAIAPLAPSVPDLTAASDTGVSSTDNITKINTPTFTGTASDAGTVQLYSDGVLVGAAPIIGGTWTVTSSVLADGPHVMTTAVLDTDNDFGPQSAGLTVLIDTVAPTFHATINAPAATGWYNIATGPAVVHYTASDIGGSGLATAVPPNHTFADGANQSLAALTISDIAGNTATSESFSGINQDTVAPTIHATINSPAATGWYNIATGPAVIHYTASDNPGGSGLASAIPGNHTFADGANQSLAGAVIADVAGNTATSESFSGINQDTVAPTFHATINAPAGTGWYNISTGPAVVHYTASDNPGGSGLASAVPGNHTFADGVNQSLAALTIFDIAGNSATSESFSGIKQDTVAPTFHATINAPAATGWYNIATGPAVVHYTASDGGSGLASAVPPDHTFADGANQSLAALTISDIAGNSTNSESFSGINQDTVAPAVVSINRSTPAGTTINNLTTSVTYAVTFSEPVTGATAAEYALAFTGSVTASTPVVVSGSGASYTVTINNISGTGSLGLNFLSDGAVNDVAGNPIPSTTGFTGQVYTVIPAPPTYLGTQIDDGNRQRSVVRSL
ncbi:MAG: type 1 secretion C-terminal target domain subclass, partial [Phycisphaerales bacterium]|nr:type 1 secretion C-terminal target domain subclass [Phycisphaerales bacterium]